MGGGGAATRFLAEAAPLSGGRGGPQRAPGGVSVGRRPGRRASVCSGLQQAPTHSHGM